MGKARDNGTVELKIAGSDELPEGWAESTIGEAYEVNPRKVPADALPPDAPVTFVPMPAVDADFGAINEPETREFSAVRKGYTSFIEDDVIVAKITPCMENGKVAIARGLQNCHGFGSSEFHVLRSTGAALPEYIYHFVRQESFRREAESRMTGSVGQKRVPPTFLSQHELPVPPLVEQKRIVAKVEALLERVNKARERLGRIPEILKRFRQSVLAAACSGRLTAEWRAENGVVDEWTTAMLSNFGTVSGGITKNAKRSSLRLKVPYLRVANVYADRLELDEVRTIGVTDAEFARTRLQEGDLLFVEGNGSIDQIGRVAVWDGSVEDCVHQNHLIKFRAGDEALPRYIVYFMMSQKGRDSLMEKAISTAGLHSLSISKIAGIEVEIPPLAEQREIVRRVEGIFAAAMKVENRFAAGVRRTERITQSVLAKGFSGELVETEADMARREGRDYEPASVLLQRVAAGQSEATSSIRLERGRAVLDILLLLEAWNKPVSISVLEPALVLMRNDAARQVLLGGHTTRRRRRTLSNEPRFVRGLDVVYSGLEANGAIRRVGQSGFELANPQLLSQASAADRAKAAEVIRAIQTLGDLRSLPQAVAAITHEQYEITV